MFRFLWAIIDVLDMFGLVAGLFSSSKRQRRAQQFGQSEPEDRRIVVWLTVGGIVFVALLLILTSLRPD